MPYIPGYTSDTGLTDRQREEDEDLFGPIADFGVSGLTGLGMLTDTPRSTIANTVSMLSDWSEGRAAERNPFTGLFTPEDRLYGEDIFEGMGVESPGLIGDIAAEIITDPLTYMSFGLSALGKYGKISKALVKSGALTKVDDIASLGRLKSSNVLKRARDQVGTLFKESGQSPAAWQAKLMGDSDLLSRIVKHGDDDAIRRLTGWTTGSNPGIDAWKSKYLRPGGKNVGFTDLELENLDDWLKMGVELEADTARQTLGHRQLRTMLTPSDVLELDTTGTSRQRLFETLKKMGLAEESSAVAARGWQFKAPVADELKAAMNARLGTQAYMAGFGPIHNKRLAKWMDYTGQKVRYAPGVRELARAFNSDLRNARGTAVQKWAPQIARSQAVRRNETQKVVQQLAQEMHQYQNTHLATGTRRGAHSGNVTEDVMRQWFEVAVSPEAKKQLARDHSLTGADFKLLENHRQIVRKSLDQTFDDMRDVGMDVAYLRDDFTAYFPRRIVEKALKFSGSDVDVDLVEDFLSTVATQGRRASEGVGVVGGTDKLKHIYKDKELKRLLEEAQKVTDEVNRGVASIVKGGTGAGPWPLATPQQAWTEFNNHFFRKYGHLFKNNEFASGKEASDTWRRYALAQSASADVDVAQKWANTVPDHAHAFLEHFKQLSPQQRAEGLYAHSPIKDLSVAMEAASDAIVSRRAILDLLGKHARQTIAKTGQLEAAYGTHLPEKSRSLREVLDKLGFRTQLFEDGKRININYAGGTAPASEKHLVELRDNILGRLYPGEMGQTVTRAGNKAGVNLVHGRGARFVDADHLDDILDNFSVSDELFADLTRLKKVYEAPDRGTIARIWDGYLSLMKGHLTTPFMSFAGRNWMSGQVRNMVIGLWSPKSVRMSHELMLGKTVKGAKEIPGLAEELSARGMRQTDADATKLLQEKIQRHNLMPETTLGVDPVNPTGPVGGTRMVEGLQPIETTPGFVPIESPFDRETGKMWFGFDKGWRERGKKARKGRKFWDPNKWFNFFQVEGMFSPKTGRVQQTAWGPIRAGQRLNSWAEGSNRISPFLEGLMKGTDELAAAKRVVDAQVDYETRAFTRFERAYMQRIFPFYKFAKGQMKWLPNELLERPGGPIPQITRAINDARGRGEYMPEYLHEGATIRTDDMFGGGIPGLAPSDPTSHRYLTGFGFMFEDPLRFMPSTHDLIAGPGKSVLSSTHPLIKFPLERIFEKSFFGGGQALDEAHSPGANILSNISGIDYRDRLKDPGQIRPPHWVDHILKNTPLSRYMSTAEQLTKPIPELKKGDAAEVIPAIANFFTGIKPKTVRAETRRAIRQDRAVEKLKELVETKNFEQHYVDDRVMLQLLQTDPEKARKVMLVQELLKKMAEEGKARGRKYKSQKDATKARIEQLKQDLLFQGM